MSLATVVHSTAGWNVEAPCYSPLTQFHAKFWGVEKEGGLSDNMEVDDSTADDISSRCYVLDIGIRGVEDKIWVRADYTRMFEFAEEFYAESLNEPRSPSPCLVITGQPGIGELFLMLLPLCTTDISDTAVSGQISLALVRLASGLCEKKPSHLVFEWGLLVVRRRGF